MIVVAARPVGVKLINSANTATVSDSSGALFTNAGHGLVDGDFVYVDSDIENYNGFWYVDQQDSSTFKLRESTSIGDLLAFVVTGTVTYYKGYSHNWSCVHLPITYKLDNNRFPVNTSDATRTIVSHSNDSNFTSITVASTLTISNTDFSHVKISGASPSTLDGVYRVLEKNGTYTQITIDLPYDVTNDFSAATVVIYYNNYATNVEIWGGLASDHPFVSIKPYELLSTLKLTPDENGRCFFSISEILKQQITPDNNPLLASAPNNLNAFTQFYIKYYETYDYLTIYDLIDTKTGDLTIDSFEGVAVDAQLPFKNQYSGHLSEYIYTAAAVYTDDLLGQFLTLFSTPIAWPSQYFDLSFLKNRSGDVILTLNGVETIYSDAGIGVYRIPITITGDEICAKVTLAAYSTSLANPSVDALADFINAGIGTLWTTGANPSTDADVLSRRLQGEVTDGYANIDYDIEVNYGTSGITGGDFTLRVRLYDSTLTSFVSDSETVGTNGPHNFVTTLTPSFVPYYMVFQVLRTGGGDGAILDIDDFTFTATAPSESLPQAQLIEELCITVNNDCCEEEIVLVWKNYLGGYDRWKFCGTKEHQIDIKEVTEQNKNILPSWPKSYGERSHTVRRHTKRISSKKVIFRSQNLTEDQRDALQYIKVSTLVQIETSKRDRRTILIDNESFKVYDEKEKLYTITFVGEYTDFLPGQKC